MYFANMYCYGMDHLEVGITGILGCMGVVYKGAQALYAVHIPDHQATNATGAAVFAQFVGHFELIETRKSGDLFVFINGSNRPSAEEEARNLKSLLNAKKATLCRIMRNLGPKSGGDMADSASILVRDRGNIELLYKHVPDDQYIAGGKGPVGQYRQISGFSGNCVPNDYLSPQGWHIMNGANCLCIKI
jgi:hypothetical protein